MKNKISTYKCTLYHGTCRYPHDVFDRIWVPAVGDTKSEAQSIDVSDAEDRPPHTVLQTANGGIFWGIFAESILSLRTKDFPDQKCTSLLPDLLLVHH